MVGYDARRLNHLAPTLDGELVTVLVGEHGKKFSIHEAPLRSKSTFFEAALSKDWKESERRTVKLPEEGVERFTTYAQWIYAGKIFMDDEHVGPHPEHYDTVLKLIDLYCMGSRLQDLDFQDAALDSLISHRSYLHLAHVEFRLEDRAIASLYKNTLAGDAMRSRLVDDFVYDLKAKHPRMPDNMKDPLTAQSYHEVLCRLATTVHDAIESTFKGRHTVCKYHHHRGGKPCYESRV